MESKIPLRTIILIFIFLEYTECQEIETNLQINKCTCPADQIINPQHNICENVTDELHVRVWNPSKSSITVININQNNAISTRITNLTCQQGFIKITSKRWDYLIDSRGRLKHHSIPSTDEYCIENFRDQMGHVRQYFEYCIKEKPIPLCCGPRQSLNRHGVCRDLDSKFDDFQFWLGNYSYEKLDAKCYNKPKFERIQLTFDFGAYNYNELDISDHEFELMNSIVKSRSYSFLEKYKAVNIPYCLGLNKTDLSYVVKSCHTDALIWNYQKDVAHVPHCCMENYAVNLDNAYECIPANVNYNSSTLIEDHNLVVEPIQFQMRCFRFQLLQLTHNDKYHMESDGSIVDANGQRIPGYRYCLGLTKTNNQIINSGFTCVRYPRTWMPKMSEWFLRISIVFTIFTLIVYLGIRDLRNKVISMCLINQQTVTLFRNLSLAVLYRIQYTSSVACLATGIFDVLASLALFTWLNVICFDYWKIIARDKFSLASSMRPGQKRRLMIKYALYGWGFPLIAALSILANQLINHPQRNYVGATKFCERIQGGYYSFMFSTQSFILVINLCLFVHLAWIIRKKTNADKERRKEQERTEGRDVIRCTDIEEEDIVNFKMVLKLSLIMGIGLLLSLTRVLIFKYTEDLPIYYYVRFVDSCVNDLQGLYIFIIFVLKKETLDLIKEEFIVRKFCKTCQRIRSFKPRDFINRISNRTSDFSISGVGTTGGNVEPVGKYKQAESSTVSLSTDRSSFTSLSEDSSREASLKRL